MSATRANDDAGDSTLISFHQNVRNHPDFFSGISRDDRADLLAGEPHRLVRHHPRTSAGESNLIRTGTVPGSSLLTDVAEVQFAGGE
jgi:hypothetical protein